MSSWGNGASYRNGVSRDNGHDGRRTMLRAMAILAWVCAGGTVLASPALAGPADDQYAVAAGHYSRKLWKLAVEEFEVFLEKYPDHARAAQSVFFLAEALLHWLEMLARGETVFACHAMTGVVLRLHALGVGGLLAPSTPSLACKSACKTFQVPGVISVQ